MVITFDDLEQQWLDEQPTITVLPPDLVYPTGELQEVFFPDDDLVENIVVWTDMAQAALESLALRDLTLLNRLCLDERNAAARHNIYSTAYGFVADRLATTPSTEGYFNDVTRSIGKDRIQYFGQKANQHRRAFENMVGNTTEDNVFSGVIRANPVW